MKIFLADLVHDWEKVSLWTFPLNVGYIGGYARKMLADEATLEIRYFKRPSLMIEAIKREKPDVVGLAHYVWNTNLNRLVFRVAKEHVPHVLTVGGGPNFTSLNAVEATARRFFNETPDCDAFVINQGERGFAELLKAYLVQGRDRERLRGVRVAGCMINDLRKNDRVQIGEILDPIRDLDEIPSPYLDGSMDEFFDEPFVPILETNRSCPYRCTFCAWGIGTGKLATFSTQRVFAEIEYISQRCKKSANIFIADANFGVLERDSEIARKLRECQETYGFPGHVGCQWNKSRPDRVLKAAREFRGISEVGASMQSLTPAVLDAIKRKNLPLSDVAAMSKQLRDEGIPTTLFSELIVGLPNETWQSHIDANKTLIDLGAEVFNYNLHLLPGTEMDSAESREKYFKRTGWRLHDNAFGIYEGEAVFEGQEVVLQTNAMSAEELGSFRFIHFLIQFMWSRKWYFDFLHLFWRAGVHPIDMIVKVAEAFQSDRGEMGDLYSRFKADHALEHFTSFEGLRDHWAQPENLERLRTGSYGKLNYLYTYDILLEHYDGFNDMLLEVAQRIGRQSVSDDPEAFIERVRDVLMFSRELRVTLTQSLDNVVASKKLCFTYDLLAWRESGYRGVPARISTGDRFEYEFFLNDRQRMVLERQLSQFRSHNLNLTLRKMSEEINADEFFYRVRPTPAAA